MTDQQLRERFVELAPAEWKAWLTPATVVFKLPTDDCTMGVEIGDFTEPYINAHAALALLKYLGVEYILYHEPIEPTNWVVEYQPMAGTEGCYWHHPEPWGAVVMAVIAKLEEK